MQKSSNNSTRKQVEFRTRRKGERLTELLCFCWRGAVAEAALLLSLFGSPVS